MIRVTDARQSEAIGAALDMLTPTMREWIGPVHWFCGTDPLFAGLHSYDRHNKSGVPYSRVAHCCYPHNLLARPADDRPITIVLPHASTWQPETIVHELGHALHARFDCAPRFAPVTAYAQTDRFEAFAEAFGAWVNPLHWYDVVQDCLYERAPDAVALFRSLEGTDGRA